MNATLRGAAMVALCLGMAACAPRGTSVGYPSTYGAADPTRYSRYDGSPYNYSDGSDPNYSNYANRNTTRYGSYGAVYGGYDGYSVAPPPPRAAYDPYYDQTPRPYYRDYYYPSETGWYDRWGRWHPSRAY